MPIYEFKCSVCEIIQEEIHSMKDAPSESKCEQCDGVIKRFYGQCNFALKGQGWPSKNIKNGIPAASNNMLEADQMMRKKNGQKTFDKEVPMSDKEFKRRKALNERYFDENS